MQSLEVSTLEGKRAEIKSKIAILACGGIENARLLLTDCVEKVFSCDARGSLIQSPH